MEKLSSIAQGLADKRDGSMLLKALRGVYDRMRCQMITTAGLVITATSGKKVPKTGAAITYGMCKGAPFTIAAGVDMPALVGTVTNAKFNVYCFFVDGAGASLTATSMSCIMGTEAATLAGVKFPPFPEGKTFLGFIIINPTGTGDFVGDTTALDDGTVVPNTVYVSAIGCSIDPSATI